MGCQFVAAPFEESEALACPFPVARLGTDNFQQALEAAEKLGWFVVQADKDIRAR